MSTEATLEQQQASDVLVAPPTSTATGVVLKRRKRGKSKSGSFQETVDTALRAEAHNGRRLSTPRSAALNGHFVLENKEKKASKIVTRVTWGAVMVVGFLIITWAGHAYVFSLVLMIQVMLFKELLSVRYRAAMEKKTPLFRTLQWSWFTIGLFYTHSDSFIQFLQRQTADVPYIEEMEGVVNYISFSGFTLCFMLSVLTLRPGLYKYQIGQLAWTIVILAITVAQLKPVSTNIFSGLFWFCFPAFCIVVNDITAYVCGLCFGRRFIRRPFFSLSPNKTWEGFLGAFICTLSFAWWFAGWLAQFPFATLSAMQLRPKTYTLRDVLLPGAGFAVSLNRTGELRNVDVDPVFTRLTTRTPEFLRSTLKLDYEVRVLERDVEIVLPFDDYLQDYVIGGSFADSCAAYTAAWSDIGGVRVARCAVWRSAYVGHQACLSDQGLRLLNTWAWRRDGSHGLSTRHDILHVCTLSDIHQGAIQVGQGNMAAGGEVEPERPGDAAGEANKAPPSTIANGVREYVAELELEPPSTTVALSS